MFPRMNQATSFIYWAAMRCDDANAMLQPHISDVLSRTGPWLQCYHRDNAQDMLLSPQDNNQNIFNIGFFHMAFVDTGSISHSIAVIHFSYHLIKALRSTGH